MQIIGFTIKEAGRLIGNTPILKQAVEAAKAYAQQTGFPVSVVGHLSTGKDREVIYRPDGTIEKIWEKSNEQA